MDFFKDLFRAVLALFYLLFGGLRRLFTVPRNLGSVAGYDPETGLSIADLTERGVVLPPISAPDPNAGVQKNLETIVVSSNSSGVSHTMSTTIKNQKNEST